ncbi:MAG: LytTR family transcriptional regulator DNA-binding domain-containing protein [Lachnospiraceae bacterium]|nr:LytTR family transcriptional regulator DNA-binding domain-containing protein [Lachnospiraceae bacterium]
MKIDIERISEGEESIRIRYKDRTPAITRILEILENDGTKLWGKWEDETVCVSCGDILYLESVDDKVFACTADKTLKIDASLTAFLLETADESFFRCSKSMVINVGRVVSLKSLSSNRIDATLENGEHIIISRRYAVEFRRLLKGER